MRTDLSQSVSSSISNRMNQRSSRCMHRMVVVYDCGGVRWWMSVIVSCNNPQIKSYGYLPWWLHGARRHRDGGDKDKAGKSTINAPPPHVSRRESEGATRQTMARKKEKWKFFARYTLAAELQVCN